MSLKEFPFTTEGLQALRAKVAPDSEETRLVGEVRLGRVIRPAAALIRLETDASPSIVTVDFPRGAEDQLGRTVMWRAGLFFGEPVLEHCQLLAAVDGALTLEDVAPLFDGLDDQRFVGFAGTEEARASAYERMANTVLQLYQQQV